MGVYTESIVMSCFSECLSLCREGSRVLSGRRKYVRTLERVMCAIDDWYDCYRGLGDIGYCVLNADGHVDDLLSIRRLLGDVYLSRTGFHYTK